MLRVVRMNGGFQIDVVIPLNETTELVIGYMKTSLGDQYVCWFCSYKNDYYWGKYCDNYYDALKSLNERLNEYLKPYKAE